MALSFPILEDPLKNMKIIETIFNHQIQENGKLFRELNNGFKVYTLDVFSDKVFGGNPLAIFPEADLLSDDLMQSIAFRD